MTKYPEKGKWRTRLMDNPKNYAEIKALVDKTMVKVITQTEARAKTIVEEAYYGTPREHALSDHLFRAIFDHDVHEKSAHITIVKHRNPETQSPFIMADPATMIIRKE